MGRKSVLKRTFQNAVMMAGAGVLATLGFGSSCPGTGARSSFDNPEVQSIRPSTIFTRYWSALPMLIDPGITDPTNSAMDRNQNIDDDNSTSSDFPLALFRTAAGKFHVIFNRATAASGVTDVEMVATKLDDISSSVWATDLSAYTTLAATASYSESHNPQADVDSQGNAMAVMNSVDVSGVPGPYNNVLASRLSYGNGAWDSPVQLNNTATDGSVGNSLAIGHDSQNTHVVIWEQNGKAFWNEYRQFLGWRTTGALNTTAWNPTAAPNYGGVEDLGMALGFDAYGAGYLAYVADNTQGPAQKKIVVGRWRSDLPAKIPVGDITQWYVVSHNSAAPVGVVADEPYGYPAVLVYPNGSATVFWWANMALGRAKLYYANAAAPASYPASGVVSFGTSARFDSNYGMAGIGAYAVETTFGHNMPIVVKNSGSKAVMGFIKSDGYARRIYLFYSTTVGVWTPLGTPDMGGSGRDVTYFDASINSSGDIAVTYSAVDPNDFSEHVYANVYSNGSWQGVTQLDSHASLSTYGAFSQYWPKVNIDDSGNAMAGFIMHDNLFGTPIRRAVVSIYR